MSATTSSDCTTALQGVIAAQQQVSRDQQAVQSAETTLAQVLSSQSRTTQPTGSGPSGSTGKAPTTGTGGSGGTSPNATAVNSAAQLASDQAAIDTQQATLASAEESLANAKLTAPIAGTVTSVNLSAGQAVAAGSTSAYITVADPGSYQTTSSLTSSQVGRVAVGDHVQVTVNGQTGASTGTVTRVGPVSTTSSSYTYPLIVALDSTSFSGKSAVTGAAAQVSIEIAHADNTLVVPTSAVHTTATSSSYVTVLAAGKPVRRTVKVGVVGNTYTQITSGLTAGTVVVLADPSQSVPSSSSNSTSTFRGGPGGTGGLPSGFPTGVPNFATGGGG